jgi:probable rRNA maturation factor
MTMKKDAGKLSVQILNEFPHPEVSESRLKKVAEKILRDLGFRQAEVSILLVGDKKMRAMNRQFLRHAWSTDVLAFGRGKIVKITRVKEPVRQGKPGNFLGDIALCIPTIEGQAEEYGHTFIEELDYCLCHGILHLLGHKDKSREDHRRMHARQKQILGRVLPRKVSPLRSGAGR